MSQCSEALLLYRGSRICVGSLVTYVCVCGGITSLGFSVDWTRSSLSRVDLSGLSRYRSCPGYLWGAAVVWAPAYSAVRLCLCLAINRRVLQYRVIFFTPRKHPRVPGYPPARVITSTNVEDTAFVTVPGYTTISRIESNTRFLYSRISRNNYRSRTGHHTFPTRKFRILRSARKGDLRVANQTYHELRLDPRLLLGIKTLDRSSKRR